MFTGLRVVCLSVRVLGARQTYETIEERVNGEVVRRYLKGKLLGKGGFAKAYWATCLQTQKQYAMKVVLKSTLTKPKAKAKLQVGPTPLARGDAMRCRGTSCRGL